MRHVVIGTAGHVDHGKTALVRALTGVDTDRWEEEKRRGITIDLGFASLALDDGIAASIVDVPGHEDFVRNMVAGATGIDIALLVIAADEGIMPQTEEHLAILEFLGIKSGIVAVSKCDIAEPDWLELVLAEVSERLERSPIHWEEPIPVSSVTGEGMDNLKAVIAVVGRGSVTRSADDLFRMPVDRSFSVAGAGTVVTGTTWSGSVSTGDTVRILPGDAKARVRSIEVHGEARKSAEPGRRTALALPNVARDEVRRGSVLVSSEDWQATTTLDVIATLLATARPLTQRSRIRVHLGTAEVFARLTPQAEDIAPGSAGSVRLRLEAPVVARWGDRGVLRSYSPVATIGGCVVVDPMPPRRPRRPQALEKRVVNDPATRVAEFVMLSGDRGISVSELSVRCGVNQAELPRVIDEVVSNGVVKIQSQLFAGAVVNEAKERARSEVEAYHQSYPLKSGMPRGLLRAAIRPPVIADAVQGLLRDEATLAIEGETVRLVGFEAKLSEVQGAEADALRRTLREAGNEGRTVTELESVGQGARDIAEFLVRIGEAKRIGADRYYDASELEKLKNDIVSEIARVGGVATPAQLRDKTGLSRKFLIPVLEWLDGEGVTAREGDGRRLGPNQG